MKQFKIYILNSGSEYLLSSFDYSENNIMPETSTFDEELQEGENDQYSLSFSLMRYTTAQVLNYNTELLSIGSKIRLELDHNSKVIDFIVTSITPELNKDNAIYKYRAQDLVSFTWSKHNTGYSYQTLNEEGLLSPKTIYGIASDILNDNGLDYDWSVGVDTINAEKFSFEIENSNPYNAILEACNMAKTYLLVDYRTRTINFYRKDKDVFSGYRYDTRVNIKSLSIDQKGDSLCTLMHVTGGENEEGEQVPLVPSFPMEVTAALMELIPQDELDSLKLDKMPDDNWYDSLQERALEFANNEDVKQNIIDFIKLIKRPEVRHLGQFLIDFSYLKDKYLISEGQYNNLMNVINRDMFINNIWLRIYTPLYYQTLYDLSSIENTLKAEAVNYIIRCRELEELYKDIANINTSRIIKIQQETAEILNNMKNYINKDSRYCELLYRLYGAAQMPKQIQQYKTLWDKYTKLYNDTQSEMSNYKGQWESQINTWQDFNPLKIQYEQQVADYESKLNTYKAAGVGWIKNQDNFDAASQYQIMYDILSTAWTNFVSSTELDIEHKDLAVEIERHENRNHQLWQHLYHNYGQFLYESTYENSDEMDSVSLFNQAIAAFELIRKPTVTYNLSVLDIAQLECIDIPNLQVGTTIRVSDKSVDLKQQMLIINGITYKLRYPDGITLTIEDNSPYLMALNKILS